LKKHFNFDNEDIKAYTAKNGKFTITDTGKCEIAKGNNKVCVAATREDILGKPDKSGKLVGGWKTENGKVAVTLSAERVKELQNFRQERVIDKAVNQISDDNTRNQVRNDLKQITTSEGPRAAAANRLMYLENVSETDSAKVREAISTVANQPENKNNPLTNLVAAKINLDEAIKNKDARGISDAEVRMNKAVKLVQGQDTVTGEYKKDAKVNREEAAFVNRQVSQTMRSIGREGEANERETLARYYEVDDKERNSIGYPNGEINRWKKSDTPSMRPLSQTEIDLREYQEKYGEEPESKKSLGEDKFKQEWKTRNYINENGRYVPDEKGGAVQQGFSRYNMKGSLRVKGTELVTKPVYKTDSGRETNIGRYNRGQNKETIIKGQESIKLSFESPELNPRGINRAFGTTSVVDGIGLINKNVPFYADLYYQKTEKQLAYRFGLEKANKLETKYPVPPKPEDLQKERTKLTRFYGNDPKAKAIVNEMMRDMEVKSHAFWNR
jgi:hypothetical protein